MNEKRIEIIFRMLAIVALQLAWPAHAGTRSYPVYVEPPRQAVPLASHTEQEEFVPDISYSYFWSEEDGVRLRARNYVRRQRVSEHSPGLWGALATPAPALARTRWLPTPSMDAWSLGARSWQTRLDADTALSLGSSEIARPVWEDSVRLGGVSLSQSFMANGEDEADWNYSLAFGAVDHSTAGTPGDLAFGPMAGSLALSYKYSPRVNLVSQTEVAGDLFMSEITGQYDLGELGRWRSGVSRSNQGFNQGWRYRVMGDVALARDVAMAWEGERYTDGFMDIRRYAGAADPAGGARQRWTASWDTGRWGTVSGSFESVHGRHGVQERRFGLNQQFYYSPNLQVGVHAEREVVGGDYDIGLRFSFPLH